MHVKCKIIGVDPGRKGAVAYVERNSLGVVVDVRIIDAILRRGNRGWLLDTEKMLDGMRIWPIADLAVMENQIQKPGKGVKTTFINFGLLLGAVERCANEIEFIEANVWKYHYKLSKNKSESIEKVRELYPDYMSMLWNPLSKTPSSDRAEALLVAEYGYTHIWLPRESGKIGTLL